LRRVSIKEVCSRCGNKDRRVLTVHHKDGNRKNNKIDNLEWLCRNCHCIIHWC
jgi:5-methylcytosine-specific restriction endonuclease McrA